MVELTKISNNELVIYFVMLLIVMCICFIPKNDFLKILTKNTKHLIVAFICACLFMLLDNRIAVLFLILLIVSYYENMKDDMSEKFLQTPPVVTPVVTPVVPTSDQAAVAEAVADAKAVADAAAVAEAAAKAIEDQASAEESNEIPPIQQIISGSGLTAAKQQHTNQKQTIANKLYNTEIKFSSVFNNVNEQLHKNMTDSSKLCKLIDKSLLEGTRISDSTDITENFIRDKLPEVVRESFVRDTVPTTDFNSKFKTLQTNNIDNNPIRPQASNFKYDKCVLNLAGLATQNEKDKCDLVGNNIESEHGEPLTNVDYNILQREFIGSSYYPLNN